MGCVSMVESNEKRVEDQRTYTIAQSPLTGQTLFQRGTVGYFGQGRRICQGVT